MKEMFVTAPLNVCVTSLTCMRAKSTASLMSDSLETEVVKQVVVTLIRALIPFMVVPF